MSGRLTEKVLGSFYGAAVGDAMGAATESFSRRRIEEVYGGRVTTFQKPAPETPAFGRRAGQITDAFGIPWSLARQIVRRGAVDARAGIDALLEWSEDPDVFERFAGMTTKKVIRQLRESAGSMNYWEYAGRLGNRLFKSHFYALSSNGAVVKAFVPGILNPGNPDQAIQDAITICMTSHDDRISISGACAVAAAASRAMEDDASVESMVDAAFYGAGEGLERAPSDAMSYPGPSVSKRLDMAIRVVMKGLPKEERIRLLADIVGTGPAIAETVPVAFALLVCNGGETMPAIVDAVNVGDETSAIAAIVGALTGARAGLSSIRPEDRRTILENNSMDIEGTGAQFCALIEKRSRMGDMNLGTA